jgi:hypothetical protein
MSVKRFSHACENFFPSAWEFFFIVMGILFHAYGNFVPCLWEFFLNAMKIIENMQWGMC